MDKIAAYRNTLNIGISESERIEQAVEACVKKGVENLFLVGCGGSLAVMQPVRYIVDTMSTLPAYMHPSNEFVHMKPKKLNERSLVILASYTGNTKETIEAAKYAKSVGAYTMAFASQADSGLAKAVDTAFINNAPIGVNDAKLLVLYQIAYKLLDALGFDVQYDRFKEDIQKLPDALVHIKEITQEESEAFAERYKDSEFFLVTSSGINWGEAYAYAMCIIQEMQWIKSHSVHAGEFFHGSFEIMEEDTDVLILHGEDETRPLTRRVIDFVKKYNKRYHIVDTKQYPLEGVSDENRGVFSLFILLAVLANYTFALAEKRNHPITTRRYMGKVPY